MNENIFHGSSTSLNMNDIAVVEKKINKKLPQSLVKQYLKFNGGRPEKRYFHYKEGVLVVNEFLCMVHMESWGKLEEIYIELCKVQGILPEYLIPVAIDDGGDFFCISTAPKSFGEIYFFWGEMLEDKDRCISFLCSSLEDFIMSLQKD